MNMYFRALPTPEHFKHWLSGDRHSYHASVPGEWIKLWQAKKSKKKEDYPLDILSGPYTDAARMAFIRFVFQYGVNNTWPKPQRLEASQLDGLCAFRKAVEALEYGMISLLGKKGKEKYVVIKGKEIGQCAEENSVLIKFHSLVDGLLCRTDFIQKYIEKRYPVSTLFV